MKFICIVVGLLSIASYTHAQLNPNGATSGNIFCAGDNVGIRIGTAGLTSKLTVKEAVCSTEVKVDLNAPGPNHVFEPTYILPFLSKLKLTLNPTAITRVLSAKMKWKRMPT